MLAAHAVECSSATMDQGSSSGIRKPLIHTGHPEVTADIASIPRAGARCEGPKYIVIRNPEERYHSSRQSVVLAIDGGGMRGIIPG